MNNRLIKALLASAALSAIDSLAEGEMFPEEIAKLHSDKSNLEQSLRTYEYSEYGALVVSEFLTFWMMPQMQHSSCYMSLPKDLDDVPSQLRDVTDQLGLRYKSKFYFECDSIELTPDHPLAEGRKRTLTPYGWVAATASPPLVLEGYEMKNEFGLFVDLHTWGGAIGVKTTTFSYRGRFIENWPQIWRFAKGAGSEYSGTAFAFTTFD